ncbi:unnamed protein product [Kuraishia capsulata CBS 1993]|uniref:Cyclin-like domain-containing protein n=1 Tax=Kuraishia capsulata CBS 1993 TaxID=1382522 RepID=W6MW21_9ASCO|nr:uncharacterized protein KUCA_T00002779001 [Kuraishia capsulata CBS 1993]CDK26805.1 unnamed protein product [Kuraishia capsulata CBS 1993]
MSSPERKRIRSDIDASESRSPRLASNDSYNSASRERRRYKFWRGFSARSLALPTNSWIFSEEELFQESPSRAKLAFKDEITRRAKGVQFIHNLAKSLNLSRLVAITASVYLHRFYMRKDILGHHYYEIAGASLFLACKAEECRRKLHDVVVWCARLSSKDPKMIVDEQTKVFWQWRDRLVRLEEKLLEVLCFDMTPDQPYKLCYDITRANESIFNKLKDYKGRGSFSEFYFHRCCTFFECAARTPLCLLFRAEVIVAVGMVLCAVEDDIKIPDQIISNDLNVSAEDVFACLQLYHRILDKVPEVKPYVAVKYPELTKEDIYARSNGFRKEDMTPISQKEDSKEPQEQKQEQQQDHIEETELAAKEIVV